MPPSEVQTLGAWTPRLLLWVDFGGGSTNAFACFHQVDNAIAVVRSSGLTCLAMSHAAQFPSYRPRRLRQSAALRAFVAETRLNIEQLVLPLFVVPGRKVRRAVKAMPGVFQLSVDELIKEATAAHELGVPAVLLFGIPQMKDARASGAYAANGIAQQAVRALKKELPQLIVITDVCLCEYMEHGHCGVIARGDKSGRVQNDPTLELTVGSVGFG